MAGFADAIGNIASARFRPEQSGETLFAMYKSPATSIEDFFQRMAKRKESGDKGTAYYDFNG